MKRKVLIIIASVLIIATLGIMLTACNKTGYINVSEVNAGFEREFSYGAATAQKLNVGDYEVEEFSPQGNYIVMSSVNVGDNGQDTVYYVVDVAANKVLYTGEDHPYLLKLASGSMIWEDVFFTVKSGTDGKMTATFMNGDRIITDGIPTEGLFNNSYAVETGRYSASEGLDLGDGRVLAKYGDGYTVKEKTVTLAEPFTENEVRKLDDHAYYVYDSGYEIAVLNRQDLSVVRNVSFYYLSEMTQNINFFSLPDNKILIQTINSLPYNTTKDYDVYLNNGYYRVGTYIYDVEKDKTEEVKDCEYIFGTEYLLSPAGVSIIGVRKINENKTVGNEMLQGFDEKLNVAFDINEILPGTDEITFSGDYTVFYNRDRAVVYRGDTRVFEAPRDKFSALFYLGSSGLFASTDGSTLYNDDGSYLVSLDELGADSFMYLDYAANYLLYTKDVVDSETQTSVSCLFAYDRANKTSEMICEYADCKMLNYGFVLVKDEDGQSYSILDVVSMEKIAGGLDSDAYTRIYEINNALFFKGTVAGDGADAGENVYYILNRG